MGQRIQIIVKIPAEFWNEDNPNNKPERILVFHNQWLYGMNFLRYAQRLIRAISFLIAKENKMDKYKGYPIEHEKIVNRAILHANNADLTYMTNSFLYDENNNSYNKVLQQSKNVLEFLKYWNNNNGYLYIEIKKNNEICYDILNGYEDADKITSRTPEEYLRLFYPNDRMAGEIKAVIEWLNNQKRCDCMKRLYLFKRKLAKGDRK